MLFDFGLDELEVIPYQTDIYFAVKCRFNQGDWEIIRSRGHSELTSATNTKDRPRSFLSKIFRRVDPERLVFECYKPEHSSELSSMRYLFPALKLESYDDLQAARVYKNTIQSNSYLLLKWAEDIDGRVIEDINSVTLESLSRPDISFGILTATLVQREITPEMQSRAKDAVSVIIESSGIAAETAANANRLRKFKSDLLCVPEKDRLPDTDELVADTDQKINDLDRISDTHCRKIKSSLENVAKAVKAANTTDKIAKAKEARAALLANLK